MALAAFWGAGSRSPSVSPGTPKPMVPSLSAKLGKPVGNSEFRLFDGSAGPSVLQVRYAFPASAPESIRLGSGGERDAAHKNTASTFEADRTVLSRLIPRSPVEYVYSLPLLAGSLGESSEMMVMNVGRLLYSGGGSEGFSFFRPDATFDVYRVMPVLAPPASGFSVGLKYRWLF